MENIVYPNLKMGFIFKCLSLIHDREPFCIEISSSFRGKIARRYVRTFLEDDEKKLSGAYVAFFVVGLWIIIGAARPDAGYKIEMRDQEGIKLYFLPPPSSPISNSVH